MSANHPARRDFLERVFWIACYVLLLSLLDVQADRGYEHGDSADEQHGNDAASYRGSIIFFSWRFLHGHGNAEALLAVFTILLMFVTAGLWFHTRAIAIDAEVSNRKQAKLTRKSLKLARAAFFASHRPRMVVRRLAFVVSGGYPVELNYTAHNVGDAAGTIVAKSGVIWLPNENESLASAIAGEETAENIPVGSGDGRPITNKIVGLNFNYGLGPRPRILFVGYLKYADSAGIVRETRFLREYSHDTKLFTAIEHPDYEYQD